MGTLSPPSLPSAGGTGVKGTPCAGLALCGRHRSAPPPPGVCSSYPGLLMAAEPASGPGKPPRHRRSHHCPVTTTQGRSSPRIQAPPTRKLSARPSAGYYVDRTVTVPPSRRSHLRGSSPSRVEPGCGVSDGSYTSWEMDAGGEGKLPPRPLVTTSLGPTARRTGVRPEAPLGHLWS